MDGGAWWAAVHGVAMSRTRLSDFTFTFQFHVLEKEMATHSSVLAWRTPGTREPGGLPFMESHRVGHDWSNLAVAVVENLQMMLKPTKKKNQSAFYYYHARQFQTMSVIKYSFPWVAHSHFLSHPSYPLQASVVKPKLAVWRERGWASLQLSSHPSPGIREEAIMDVWPSLAFRRLQPLLSSDWELHERSKP